MKRLTLKNVFEMNMTELALNQVYIYDGWTWYRKAPEDECSACDLIRKAAKALDVDLDPDLTDEDFGEVMLDWLQFGEAEPEGVLAILYRALWAMAEVRGRLKLYEDICFAADGAELLTPWVLRVLRDVRLKNNPLDPEELLDLEGEPVYLSGEGLDRWDIFSGISTDGLACFLRGALPMDGCGKTWTPYRRKPEAQPAKGGPACDAEGLHQGGADLRH